MDKNLILPAVNGCHIWLGHRHPHGYGMVEGTYAHRLAWEEVHGPIPPGMCVLHYCDNPPCVNPQHLRLGTQLQNLQDMARKGRAPLARLTPAQVNHIRRSMLSAKKLAAELSVSEATIYRIRKGNTWKP